MRILSSTVGIPVTDLGRSQLWYEAVFELPMPETQPVAGIVEYRVGEVWLQLAEEQRRRPGEGFELRFGIPDVAAQHARLQSMAVEVSPLMHVEGSVDFFDAMDPDGNVLGFYSLR
ncbi:MAG: VOC family protein [Microbacteriaceae bacterium]